MSETLKPCPFCGGTRFVIHEGRYGCINGMCAAEAPMAAWNRRAADPAIVARLRRLEAALYAEADKLVIVEQAAETRAQADELRAIREEMEGM